MFGIQLGKKWGDRIFAIGMVAPAFILLIALSVYPFLTAVQSSFFTIHTITRVESYVGVKNYIEALTTPLFWQSLWRSIVWTVGGVIPQLILGIVCSLVLHAELKGRNLARGIVLFPYLVPAIVASIVWRFMFNPLTGVVNYVLVEVLHLLKELHQIRLLQWEPKSWEQLPPKQVFPMQYRQFQQ